MMHPIENMMKSSMEQIREMVDVNTIIGDPVHTPDGAVILPVSKVSFGFVSGGGEYGKGGSVRESSKDLTENPFAGGSGAGISLHPVGFVVVSGESVRLLPIETNSPFDHLSEIVPQVFQFAKELMTQKGRGEEKQKQDKKQQETPTVQVEIHADGPDDVLDMP